MPEADSMVYVSTKSLETSGGAPPRWHADEDCNKVDELEEVTEMPLSEAKRKCSRQAQCCSTVPTLEDLD